MMDDIKANLFEKDLEKLLDQYKVYGAFYQLEENEQCLACICANKDGIEIKLNEQVIKEEEFKKVIESIYNNYCK
jgi:hypothetical protein